MERIKVNFNLGGLRVDQGEIECNIIHDLTLYKEMNRNNEPFITIYNEFGDPVLYNKKNIVWICVQTKDNEKNK